MKKGKEFRAEVAIVGGGVAGLAAAVAAARAGAGVCLVENNGFLGGIATAGLVGRFQEGPYVKGSPVIRGLYREICQRLQGYDALRGELFDPESMKYVAFDLCEENGVKLLLHSKAYEADVQSGQVEGFYIATKQGSQSEGAGLC